MLTRVQIYGEWFFGCNTKKGEHIYGNVFGKSPIHQYYVHTTGCGSQHMPLFADFTGLFRNI